MLMPSTVLLSAAINSIMLNVVAQNEVMRKPKAVGPEMF